MFSFKLHPKVKAGVASVDELFEKFCRLMEAEKGEIQYSYFFDFFLLISLMTERDNVFFNLLHALFSV